MTSTNTNSSSITRFFQGFKAFFQGLSFISTHSLWKYLILPALLSAVLGSALAYFGYSLISSAIISWFDAQWWLWVLLIKLLSAVIAFFVIIIGYSVLVAALITPFMGSLLAKTELILLGKEWKVSFGQDMKNVFIGIGRSLKMAVFNIALMILASFTLFLQPLFSLFITGYFLGNAAFYAVIERNFNKGEDRAHYLKQYKAEMCGLGVANIIMLLIPVVGLFLAPAASISGASLLFYRKDTMKLNQ